VQMKQYRSRAFVDAIRMGVKLELLFTDFILSDNG